MCCKEDFNLNTKQFLFCQEYIAQYCNGTRAYMKVYKSNYDTARSESSRLLAKPNVKACVDKLLEEYKFNKQLIINSVVMDLISIAKGEAQEVSHIEEDSKRDGKTIRDVVNKTNNRDRNNACDILLKLFGAYNSTTSSDTDEDMEELKTSKNTSVNVKVDGFDDESK